MRIPKSLGDIITALALVWVIAGCSTNAGFGTPATEPNPVGPQGQPGAPQPYYTVSPMPSGSGFMGPYGMMRPTASPVAAGSATPTAPPAPNSVSVVGPSLRLAYDASAKDPVKAARILELSFALENTTQNSAKVTNVAVYANKASLGTTPVLVNAAAGQVSDVAQVALKTSDDPQKYKQMVVNFLDDSKKMVASSTLDVPAQDASFTSLDEKHPKGPLTIDDVEISPIAAGDGVHFESTFAITNASANPVSITELDITPPKGTPVKVMIPLDVPARSASGFMSIVVPYNGKSLPSGDYTISAQQKGTTVAKASAVSL